MLQLEQVAKQKLAELGSEEQRIRQLGQHALELLQRVAQKSGAGGAADSKFGVKCEATSGTAGAA